ncbi:TonB-dependent siderophore receptor [Methylomonas koyamae]|nr:TonB-dependent receptor [Methylomonas koyamae]
MSQRFSPICTTLFAAAMSASPWCAAEGAIDFAIPAAPLADALLRFSEASGVKVFFSSQLAGNLRGNAVQGRFTPQQALQKLLEGSGLTAKTAADGAVTLQKTANPAGPQSANPTAMPAVTVVGQPLYDDEDPYSLSYTRSNTALATKTDTPIMETPASIQVVTRRVMQDQQAYRLQDALKNVSGVQSYHGYGGMFEQFVLRGFLQSTVGYRNGVRIPFTKFDLANVERVEVLKGASAMLYGFSDPGGMISTVTKQPSDVPYYSIEQRFGSYDFYRTEASATGPIDKKHGLNYRVDFSYLDSGSFRQFMGNERVFFAPSISWQVSPDTKLTLSYEHFDDDYTYDAGTPAFGNKIANLPIERTFAQSGLSNSMINDTLDFRIDHRVNDHVKLNAGAVGYLTKKNWEGIYLGRVNENPASADYQKVARSTWFSPERTDSLTAWINGAFDFDTFGVKHKLLFGGEYHDTNLDYQVYNARVDENGDGVINGNDLINLFTFDPQNSNLPIDQYRNTPPTTSNIVTQNTSKAIYFQDQMTFWNKLHLLGGFRYDWVQRFQNLSWNGPNSADARSDIFISPRVGILYEPVSWLSVFGSFSESFGPANDYDLGGARLYPLFSATQFEGGIKTQFYDGKLTANLTYFDLERTQFYQDSNNPNPRISVPVKGQSNGVELDIQGRIYEGLRMVGTYAYTDAKVVDDPRNASANVGHRLPYAPIHQGSLWLKYDFSSGVLNGFSIGTGVYTAGRRYGDPENSYSDGAYARLDLMAAYKMKLGDTRLTTQVNLNNVNDAEYYSMRARRYNLPAEPLSVIGSIKLEY